MSRPLDPRLVRAAPELRRLLAILAAVQACSALLLVAQADLIADIISSIFHRHDAGHQLLTRLLLLGAAGVARALLSAAQEWAVARSSVRIRARLRRRVLEAIVGLGPAWVDRQPSGRLVTAAGPGLEALDGYLTRSLPALVSAAIVPVVVLARIGMVDWLSAGLLVAALPLVPLFMILVGKTTQRRVHRQYAALARLSGHFLDLVQGLATLKIYGRTRHQVRLVEQATDAYRRRTMSMLRTAFLSGLVLDLIATLSVAVVAVDVGLRLDHSRIGLDTALVVLLLTPEVFAPLRAMGAQHHSSEQGRVAAQAALDVIDESETIAIEQTLANAANTDGSITFESVQLSYPTRTTPALDGFDLAVAPGEVIALQGRSGAGKSTAIACLLGFITPDQGRIMVGTAGGTSAIADLEPQTWRQQLAWVPQRPTPTQANVGAEIALGDAEATDRQVADVIASCHAPHADTALGEDGDQVSAGQRRRIAMARALLRARRQIAAGAVPIILLDEPSEDLDEATELVIAAIVSSLAGRATIIMATHSDRLAAIADRVVVVDTGRVTRSVSSAAQRVAVAPLPPGAPTVVVPTAAVTEAVASVLPPRRVISRLWGAGLLSGAAGIAGLALTATSLWLICRAAQHPNVQALEIAVVGVRAFALARAMLRYAERLVSHDFALRMLSEVRARIFAALGPLVPGGVANLRRGDLLRRFVADIDTVQDGLVRAVVPFAGAALTCAAAIALAAVMAPAAGITLAAGLAVAGGFAPWLSAHLAGDAAHQTAVAGQRDAMTSSLLDGIRELTAFGAHERSVLAIVDADAELSAATRRPAISAMVGVAISGTAAGVTLPVALACGAAAARNGTLSVVSVAVLAACVLAGFDAVAQLPTAFAAWSRLRAALDRITQVLGAPIPVAEPSAPTSIADGATGLRATKLSLAPALDAPVVLYGAELSIRAGERVAVIGPSGCGKSTLLASALRLLPARQGRMELTRDDNATPLADFCGDQVPPLIAGSLQGDHVFNTSLRDNLRVVRPEATDFDLDVVAANAGLTAFVQNLPTGWDCAAGPDGAALSGGQRQRLLLARALLADPDVLVLDEPTAHLDRETELEVLADLLSATTGRTVLMSTHRRLPADRVDQVLRIEDRALVPM